MKKVYEPLNMVMNGRYAVLYKKLEPQVQAEVLANMARLISEKKEYADKGNYGHLHNIDFQRTQTLCQGAERPQGLLMQCWPASWRCSPCCI